MGHGLICEDPQQHDGRGDLVRQDRDGWHAVQYIDRLGVTPRRDSYFPQIERSTLSRSRHSESLTTALFIAVLIIFIISRHVQLRNYISTTDAGLIYYASSKAIYCLHTSTRKRELIAVLPWEPICLAAAYGWIVVGGLEKGRCALVKVKAEGSEESSLRASQHHAEVDALLPLDLDPQSRFEAHRFLAGSRSDTELVSGRKAEVQILELGAEIVNSATIYLLRGDGNEIQDELLAVFTNNDHTVRIYSLTQSRELDTLHFPFAMNHATISPDGSLLVAVGDEPLAYFYRRVAAGRVQLDDGSFLVRHEWQLVANPVLQATGPGDKGMCFTSAFSPSGHICAVSSQDGIITIFDTSLIQTAEDDDDAVFKLFRSSRSVSQLSVTQIAPRSMSFSPAPWDLLAWAEDHGRVCVADVRHAFQSRQTIHLDVDDPDIDRAEIADLADDLIHPELRALNTEARFVRQYREARDAQDDAAAVNHAADYIEASAERRRLQREARAREPSNSETTSEGLTERERQLLDTLRTSRERMNERERAEAQQQSPFSINLLPPARTARLVSNDSTYEEYLTTMGHPTTSSATNSRASATLRDYIRERNLERSRTGDRTYQPRRRSSIVISNSTSNEPTPPPLSSRTGTANLTLSPPRLSDLPAPPISSSDPWQTIEAAMQSGPLTDAATRVRREREAAIEANLERRQHQWARMEITRNQRIRQLYDGGGEGLDSHEVDLSRPGRHRNPDPDVGLGTMGLGWSGDGRLL